METIYELWGKRNPDWEKRYQETIMDVFTDYSKGVNKYQEIRGKTFGAGYEIYIIAFFIGLYFNQTKPLAADKDKRKNFGQAIMYWGNIETRLNRKAYPRIREYIFAALVAKTDIDWIALDKGEIAPKVVVDKLIDKMEGYANFGFDYMQEKLDDDPNYFFKETSFLRIFTSFLSKDKDVDNDDSDMPESLDDDPIETSINKSIESISQPKVSTPDSETPKEKKGWYTDETDFEVKLYRKGSEFWEKVAKELADDNNFDANDIDFLHNVSRSIYNDRLLSDKQVKKLFFIVKKAEKAGYDLN